MQKIISFGKHNINIKEIILLEKMNMESTFSKIADLI